jgi:hypothetical protein
MANLINTYMTFYTAFIEAKRNGTSVSTSWKDGVGRVFDGGSSGNLVAGVDSTLTTPTGTPSTKFFDASGRSEYTFPENSEAHPATDSTYWHTVTADDLAVTGGTLNVNANNLNIC